MVCCIHPTCYCCGFIGGLLGRGFLSIRLHEYKMLSRYVISLLGCDWLLIVHVKGNYVIVATGMLYQNGRQTEIVDLNNANFKCTGLTPFPKEVAYAAGGIVQGIPIICGGANSTIDDANKNETITAVYNDCYQFKNRSWYQMERGLDVPKFNLGIGNLVVNDLLLIHGGQKNEVDFVNSSQWIGLNNHSSPFDSFPVSGHCNMQINQTHFMVTGGTIPDRNNGKPEATDLTYFCPINSFKKCILGPPLNHRRRAHSCYTSNFKGKQYLNVVGGYITTSSSESTDQEVEYLVLSEITKGWQLSK